MRVNPQSRLTLVFILVTVFLDIVGLGIIIPVLPGLILELTGETVTNAAVIGGYLVFVYASMQFVFSPILGNLSDRWGRRPILLLSLVGLSVDYLIMAWAPTLLWLFVGRVLSGICGAAMGTATAYVADITPRDKRSQRFGLIGAAFGLGFIVGPVIGGELGEFGPRAPFYVAAAVAAANVVFGFFVLPESLSKFRRRRFDYRRANPFGAILAFRHTPVVLVLLGSLFLFALAGQTYPNVWNFFTIKQFDWSPSQVGRSLGVFGILFALSQAVLIGPSIRYLGVGRTVLLGMTLAIIAFIGVSLIDSETGVWVFLVIGSLSGIAVPALNGLLANNVKDNQQGELQGAVNATNSLTAIIAPVAATQLFAFFTSPEAPVFFPGVPFFAAGILIGLSGLLFLYAGFRHRLGRQPFTPARQRPVMTPPTGQAVNPPQTEELPDAQDPLPGGQYPGETEEIGDIAAAAPRPGFADIRLVVVMGVSGSGKSTVGEGIAERLGIPFLDGDHMHPDVNIEKMRSGIPLDDADRWPWLSVVAGAMRETAEQKGRVVCTCSALKRRYRDFLVSEAGERIAFVLLHGDKETIAKRQANRPGHFMPASLLDTQFAILEPFEPDEDGVTLDVAKPVEALVAEAAAVLDGSAPSSAQSPDYRTSTE